MGWVIDPQNKNVREVPGFKGPKVRDRSQAGLRERGGVLLEASGRSS